MNRQPYPTDLSDAQWHRLARLVPKPKPGGRPPKYPRREILNAILYVVRTGCAWRLLPHDFPSWRIVYHYFPDWRNFKEYGNASMTACASGCARPPGRSSQPAAAILDSQSIKTTDRGGEKGYRETGQRAQAAHPGRHARLAAGGRGHGGFDAGP
jgi:transposase